jgi:hypothetical protein
MQQGAVIILIFLWVLAIIIILAVLKGYDDSDNPNALSAISYSSNSKQLPQTYILCLSE